MRQPLNALVLAVLLGLLAAFAAACASGDKSLLTSGKADSIKSSLDDLDSAVAAGRCDRAAKALDQLDASISTLPPSTARDLRQRLEEGAANLRDISPGECQDKKNETHTDTTTTETVPTTTETTPTQTTPPTTETTPTQTTPTTTTPTQTTPTPTTTTPPDGTGGDEAPTTTP